MATSLFARPSARMAPLFAPNLFAEFTALSNKFGAANLGQGFPSYGSPDFLKDGLQQAVATDVFTLSGCPAGLGNQYTRPGGDPELCAILASEYSAGFDRELNPMTEVVTTVGAQEGLFTTLYAFTNPGDEIAVVEPCFDAPLKDASVMNLTVKGVPLEKAQTTGSAGDWVLDPVKLEAALTQDTRILFLNSPSSPLGKVFDRAELEQIAAVVLKFPQLMVVSDEVYEKTVYDGLEHVHFASLPGMYERTVTLFSAGKTFACTGWRVGYIIAPPELAAPLSASHTAMNFCAPTPLQRATAHAFKTAARTGYFSWLADMMQAKRDRLVGVLSAVGLAPDVPQGGYFVVTDTSVVQECAGINPHEPLPGDAQLVDRPDVKTCKWMAEHVGVTPIPVSPFYTANSRHLANQMARFAFCKDEDTIELAAERLLEWNTKQSGTIAKLAASERAALGPPTAALSDRTTHIKPSATTPQFARPFSQSTDQSD